jgi:hypothetical protein
MILKGFHALVSCFEFKETILESAGRVGHGKPRQKSCSFRQPLPDSAKLR